MHKYVRVMDGLKSNAGGFEYKLDEINIAEKWNPNSLDPEEMGGFNFGMTRFFPCLYNSLTHMSHAFRFCTSSSKIKS